MGVNYRFDNSKDMATIHVDVHCRYRTDASDNHTVELWTFRRQGDQMLLHIISESADLFEILTRHMASELES